MLDSDVEVGDERGLRDRVVHVLYYRSHISGAVVSNDLIQHIAFDVELTDFRNVDSFTQMM